jgi:hypothetical protein
MCVVVGPPWVLLVGTKVGQKENPETKKGQKNCNRFQIVISETGN